MASCSRVGGDHSMLSMPSCQRMQCGGPGGVLVLECQHITSSTSGTRSGGGSGGSTGGSSSFSNGGSSSLSTGSSSSSPPGCGAPAASRWSPSVRGCSRLPRGPATTGNTSIGVDEQWRMNSNRHTAWCCSRGGIYIARAAAPTACHTLLITGLAPRLRPRMRAKKGWLPSCTGRTAAGGVELVRGKSTEAWRRRCTVQQWEVAPQLTLVHGNAVAAAALSSRHVDAAAACQAWPTRPGQSGIALDWRCPACRRLPATAHCTPKRFL